MKNLEDALADHIYLDNEFEATPTVKECKSLIEDSIIELKLLPEKLSALPFDFCSGQLLESAIEDAVENIDWEAVLAKVKFFRMEDN